MVTVAQLAEPWIVAPVVVGSSPIGHPFYFPSSSFQSFTNTFCLLNYWPLLSNIFLEKIEQAMQNKEHIMSKSDLNKESIQKLPVPTDDGACNHLSGLCLPALSLMSTTDASVNLAQLPGTTVIYCYPRTGRPDEEPPAGWDLIPGAKGCTPQSCAFRDHYQELRQAGAAQVFGLSTQTTPYQQEAASRLHLSFPLLSDAELAFTHALHLPTFDVAGMTLLKRLTLIITDGKIVKVFYPVFPPDQNATDVLAWLSAHFVG